MLGRWGTRLTHPQRVLGAATLWGTLWALGILVVLGPILPLGVNPRGVLMVGASGFVVGGVLNGGLVYLWRSRDLTEIGVGGFRLLSQQMAAGIAHVLGASWIAFRLIPVYEGDSFFSGFPGIFDVVALSAGLVALPIWAFLAAVIRLTTKAKGHVLFLLTDLLAIPVFFLLFLNFVRGFG